MLARACPGRAAHPSAAFGRRCPEGVQLSILACYMPALVLLPPGIEQHTGAGTASARMPEGGGVTRDGRVGHGMSSRALQNPCWRALRFLFSLTELIEMLGPDFDFELEIERTRYTKK